MGTCTEKRVPRPIFTSCRSTAMHAHAGTSAPPRRRCDRNLAQYIQVNAALRNPQDPDRSAVAVGSPHQIPRPASPFLSQSSPVCVTAVPSALTTLKIRTSQLPHALHFARRHVFDFAALPISAMPCFAAPYFSIFHAAVLRFFFVVFCCCLPSLVTFSPPLCPLKYSHMLL